MNITRMVERFASADEVALRMDIEEVKREAAERVGRYGDNWPMVGGWSAS